RVDRGVVDEDVGAAALLGDESEALFGVEPLHGSGSHKPSLGPKGCPAPEPASVKTRIPHNCICLRTTRARGHMLRRLCTARETKLQLADEPSTRGAESKRGQDHVTRMFERFPE